mmetsp:Transcript_6089/g.15159  ORF Transcript_6089/g.15159 Transcript_6089/m.15159 type:complete len:221 (-) Transcript_6089:4325-4987(-)
MMSRLCVLLEKTNAFSPSFVKPANMWINILSFKLPLRIEVVSVCSRALLMSTAGPPLRRRMGWLQRFMSSVKALKADILADLACALSSPKMLFVTEDIESTLALYIVICCLDGLTHTQMSSFGGSSSFKKSTFFRRKMMGFKISWSSLFACSPLLMVEPYAFLHRASLMGLPYFWLNSLSLPRTLPAVAIWMILHNSSLETRWGLVRRELGTEKNIIEME